MILFVFLLFISAANLVKCLTPQVEFPAGILDVDLQVIERYHSNIDNKIVAFIHWPNDIIFVVTRVERNDGHYLKIEGTYNLKKKMRFPKSYEGLFYRNKKFYVLSKKSETMKDLDENAVVTCEPKANTTPYPDSYLKIRYRNIDEIQEAVEPFYNDHRHYLESYSDARPSIYLASWNNPTEQFLEFTSGSKTIPTVPSKLIALTGKVTKNKIQIMGSEYVRLQLNNENQENVEIRAYGATEDDEDDDDYVLDDVIGVAMDRIGFLTEVRGKQVRMLSSSDVVSGRPVSKHAISIANFLELIQRVEPIACDVQDSKCEKGRPKKVQFQIYGHILIKKINYREGSETEVKEDCPVVIEYETEGLFLVGSHATSQICTNDETIWPVDDTKFQYHLNQDITLHYPSVE